MIRNFKPDASTGTLRGEVHDRLFKKIGLTGRAVIPMVLGLGCDTMATMVTRTLPTKRERIIATIKMFFITGDPMIQYNFTSIPLLSIVEAGFFLVGFFLLIKNIGKVSNALVLTISVALTLPVVFSDSTPHILRGFGMIPFLYLNNSTKA